MKILRLVLPGLLFCLAITGCRQETEVTTLRIGHALDVEHSVHKAMLHMAKQLAHYSNNTMQLKVYPSAQLGKEREMVELLQIGSLAMTKVSAAAIEGFVPEMKLYGVPYLFENRDHKWRVLHGEVGQELLSHTQKAHLVGLGYYDSGSRSFYMTDKKVETPVDLDGQKIRVMQSPSAVAMVNTLGGSATPISFGELYAALQQGVVDGAENNPPSFYLSRHYEISKYYVLDEHTSVPDVIIASKHIIDSLTEQQRTWLKAAVQDSIELQKTLWLALEEKSLMEVKKHGVEVIYPDKQPFIDALAPLYESLNGTNIGDYVERINALKTQGAAHE
ncbi:TRAP transporter substrate-binding protein [Thalassotalea sp. PLHSN55]|uniref:TRAP transporter substrate-binding protein n=1 Tax=Thalassotalea sp. PLHSN55 TaxID=3435888 RepID=UPI003F869B5F